MFSFTTKFEWVHLKHVEKRKLLWDDQKKPFGAMLAGSLLDYIRLGLGILGGYISDCLAKR